MASRKKRPARKKSSEPGSEPGSATARRQPRESASRSGFSSADERQIRGIAAGLHELYPDADAELDYTNPLELLVATILSAQSTDKRVNMVTADLFSRYRTAADYAAADPESFGEEIRSTGFYRNKAKAVIGCARRLVEVYDGEVPPKMEELVTLPGVARKTANVVLGTAFGIADGFVVDTHVKRLAYRLGLSAEKDPEKIERDLMERFPRDEWIFLGHAIIWHGRRVCIARKPACDDCSLRPHCPRNGVDEEPGSKEQSKRKRDRS